MSNFADGAWNDRREDSDDPEPFEEQARDTIETPPVCDECGSITDGTECECQLDDTEPQ